MGPAIVPSPPVPSAGCSVFARDLELGSRYAIEVNGREIILRGPEAPDDVVREAETHGDAEPGYWAHVWESARTLARYIDHSLLVAPGTRVLEVGCGLGLVGIVTALRGASVTMTDVDARACDAARANAALNGASVEVARFDWNDAPDDRWRPDVLLGADVLYRAASHAAIARLIGVTGATGILADPNRRSADGAAAVFADHGLRVWSAQTQGGRIFIVQPE